MLAAARSCCRALDAGPIYGGFFWINGDSTFPVPKEAYYMQGAPRPTDGQDRAGDCVADAHHRFRIGGLRFSAVQLSLVVLTFSCQQPALYFHIQSFNFESI